MEIMLMTSRRRARRPRLTRRKLAQLIAMLRSIECAVIHAEADDCQYHAFQAAIARASLDSDIPSWLRKPDAWHDRISAPAVREYARMQASQ